MARPPFVHPSRGWAVAAGGRAVSLQTRWRRPGSGAAHQARQVIHCVGTGDADERLYRAVGNNCCASAALQVLMSKAIPGPPYVWVTAMHILSHTCGAEPGSIAYITGFAERHLTRERWQNQPGKRTRGVDELAEATLPRHERSVGRWPQLQPAQRHGSRQWHLDWRACHEARTISCAAVLSVATPPQSTGQS